MYYALKRWPDDFVYFDILKVLLGLRLLIRLKKFSDFRLEQIIQKSVKLTESGSYKIRDSASYPHFLRENDSKENIYVFKETKKRCLKKMQVTYNYFMSWIELAIKKYSYKGISFEDSLSFITSIYPITPIFFLRDNLSEISPVNNTSIFGFVIGSIDWIVIHRESTKIDSCSSSLNVLHLQ